MENKKKPNIKVLALVGFIIFTNLLVIIFAFLGNGALTISMIGFNVAVVVIIYFIMLGRKRETQSIESNDDQQ